VAYFPLTGCIEGVDTSGFPGPKKMEKAGSCGLHPATSFARHTMKKDEEQKALFEIWLAAYNDRLVQVAQGGTAGKPRVGEPSARDEERKPKPPSGPNA
jgi:hypothetical protein